MPTNKIRKIWICINFSFWIQNWLKFIYFCCRITKNFCFSNRGHGLYFSSPSEIQKFTVSSDFWWVIHSCLTILHRREEYLWHSSRFHRLVLRFIPCNLFAVVTCLNWSESYFYPEICPNLQSKVCSKVYLVEELALSTEKNFVSEFKIIFNLRYKFQPKL